MRISASKSILVIVGKHILGISIINPIFQIVSRQDRPILFTLSAKPTPFYLTICEKRAQCNFKKV